MILVAIDDIGGHDDAHLKWIEAEATHASTARTTVQALRKMFATHSVPKEVVSDNGPCFTSELCRQFMRKNGIRHIRVVPYHPSANGLAELAVQTVKKSLRCQGQNRILEEGLAAFLQQYRIIQLATTGVAPCELLMGRRLATRLDLVFPDVEQMVRENQA